MSGKLVRQQGQLLYQSGNQVRPVESDLAGQFLTVLASIEAGQRENVELAENLYERILRQESRLANIAYSQAATIQSQHETIQNLLRQQVQGQRQERSLPAGIYFHPDDYLNRWIFAVLLTMLMCIFATTVAALNAPRWQQPQPRYTGFSVEAGQ